MSPSKKWVCGIKNCGKMCINHVLTQYLLYVLRNDDLVDYFSTHRHAHTGMHTQACTHRHAHTGMHTQACTHTCDTMAALLKGVGVSSEMSFPRRSLVRFPSDCGLHLCERRMVYLYAGACISCITLKVPCNPVK